MNKNKINISIVIIGYNSESDLKNLLFSIKKINNFSNVLEIIYVDDGSNDDSVSLFQSFNCDALKKDFSFQKNLGRVFATQKGAQLAAGNWILFLQSNVVVLPNIIDEYVKIISKNSAYAYAGKINYQSKDFRFQNYLNNPWRGLNASKNNRVIDCGFLLFGNCIIKKSIVNQIPFNKKLKHYGGEELDFAYHLDSKFPNMIRCCLGAVVVRQNFPSLKNHLFRMFEYGYMNLKELEPLLQKKVAKRKFLLNNYFFLLPIINCFFLLIKVIYQLRIVRLDSYIIRILLLLSILKGWHTRQFK